jgi:DNA-binding response OmpR family regulator
MSLLRCDTLEMDPARFLVHRGGRQIILGTAEFSLLELFLRNPGRTFTRLEILRHLKADASGAEAVTSCIHRLRVKVDAPFRVRLIHTVRGVGYRLASLP